VGSRERVGRFGLVVRSRVKFFVVGAGREGAKDGWGGGD